MRHDILQSTPDVRWRVRPRRTGGYSITEMLCVVAILGITLPVCGTILATGLRMSALGTLTLERIDSVRALEEEFVKTVRAAEGVAPEAGTYRSGPAQVVLRMPAEEGQPRFVVFGALADAEHLAQLEFTLGGETQRVLKWAPYRMPFDRIRFGYDTDEPAHTRLVRLNVRRKPDRGESGKGRPVHRFMAAPRGMAGNKEQRP